jgi:hypothetical protein
VPTGNELYEQLCLHDGDGLADEFDAVTDELGTHNPATRRTLRADQCCFAEQRTPIRRQTTMCRARHGVFTEADKVRGVPGDTVSLTGANFLDPLDANYRLGVFFDGIRAGLDTVTEGSVSVRPRPRARYDKEKIHLLKSVFFTWL